MILNFKEIPPANGYDGQQDAFELFARDFLKYRGYVIVEGPDRGADRGRDLIVEKEVDCDGSTNTVRFLVSCKHKAHSGNAVYPQDEQHPRDDVEDNDCEGFIAFYSTIVSSRLGHTLDKMRQKMPVVRYDPASIEGELLESREGQELAIRYFPDSMTRYLLSHPLYPTTATAELARRLHGDDPDYGIGLNMAYGHAIVSVISKNPEVPPPTVVSLAFQFDRRRDGKKFEEFKQLFTAGKPVRIPKKNIQKSEFHRVLVAAYPWLAEQLEAIYLHPLPQVNAAEFDLIIESASGEELTRYPRLVFDRSGGTESFELTNASHMQPLTVKLSVIPEDEGKHLRLSLTADSKGFTASAALRAYRFMESIVPGVVLRFVEPDTSIGKLQFVCPFALEPSATLKTLEYLESIQNYLGEVMTVPEQGLTDGDAEGIEYLGRMLPTGVASDIESMTMEVDLEHEHIDSFLDDSDIHEKYFALVGINEWVSVSFMGREVNMGPILTYGIPTQFTRESVEALRAAKAVGGVAGSLRAVPGKKGNIKRYLLNRLSDDEFENLRAVIPGDAMEMAYGWRKQTRQLS